MDRRIEIVKSIVELAPKNYTLNEIRIQLNMKKWEFNALIKNNRELHSIFLNYQNTYDVKKMHYIMTRKNSDAESYRSMFSLINDSISNIGVLPLYNEEDKRSKEKALESLVNLRTSLCNNFAIIIRKKKQSFA